MDDRYLTELLEAVSSGACKPDEAVAQLRHLPFSDLGFARVDHQRELRTGLVEAVFAPGKTASQCASIVQELLERASGPVLLTRANSEQAAVTLALCPGAERTPEVGDSTCVLTWRPAAPRAGKVVVVTAGTADLPIAHECSATLRAYGFAPRLLVDCGVAGIHRLFASLDELADADAVVVVAGMEGALASVVGGLCPAPIVAVPTSVGYGASLEGVTALLAMLASCASGVTVVGIDNGYGAVVRVRTDVAMNLGDKASTQSNTRLAWFHCFAGIAGDMALASLLDAGADFSEVHKMLSSLQLKDWSIEPVSVLRCGIASTHLRLLAPGDGAIRTFPAVRELIEQASLPPRVRDRSMAAFSALADTEARLHRRERDDVHFHELSGYDTILDVVGTMAALEVLEIDEVFSSAVTTGVGVIHAAHGILPNPSPAVLGILQGAPLEGIDLPIELTTPTGAALLATLVTSYGAIPPMQIVATGYGAGTKEIDGLPNCVQVVIGERSVPLGAKKASSPSGQPLLLLEANLDDATGEQLADTLSELLDAGAQDAWVTPVVMKKGRPGHIVSVLCDLALVAQLRTILMNESGSFGARSSVVERWAATRELGTVDVEGHAIRVKISPGRTKVEHDDVSRVAAATGLSKSEVRQRAERAWRERYASQPSI